MFSILAALPGSDPLGSFSLQHWVYVWFLFSLLTFLSHLRHPSLCSSSPLHSSSSCSPLDLSLPLRSCHFLHECISHLSCSALHWIRPQLTKTSEAQNIQLWIVWCAWLFLFQLPRVKFCIETTPVVGTWLDRQTRGSWLIFLRSDRKFQLSFLPLLPKEELYLRVTWKYFFFPFSSKPYGEICSLEACLMISKSQDSPFPVAATSILLHGYRIPHYRNLRIAFLPLHTGFVGVFQLCHFADEQWCFHLRESI